MSDNQFIKQCTQGDKAAQFELVKRYSGMLMTVCRRYTKDKEIAKDLLQESLIQILTKIDHYKPTGSFEAWMRTVTVRCCLQFLKLNANRVFSGSIEMDEKTETISPIVFGQLEVEEIISLIQHLPEGFRTVFNLYTIEGYSHKEISSMLNITESGSRSQLSRARGILKNKIQQSNSLNHRSA